MTLSLDEKLVNEARKVAIEMDKSLEQLICEHLEQMIKHKKTEADFEEFVALSGQGKQGWAFDRGALHERA